MVPQLIFSWSQPVHQYAAPVMLAGDAAGFGPLVLFSLFILCLFTYSVWYSLR